MDFKVLFYSIWLPVTYDMPKLLVYELFLLSDELEESDLELELLF